MATLVSTAGGNLTTAATWNIADATSLSNSNAGTTGTVVAGANSTAFTPGAITISGLGIKLSTRAASPTGTVTIELRQAGITVVGTSITLNPTLVDPVTVATHGGWYFFQFASPVTLLAATAYTLFVSSTTASALTLYTNGTASNWSRVLMTTSTQAPAAGDTLLIGAYYVDSLLYKSVFTTNISGPQGIAMSGNIMCVANTTGSTLEILDISTPSTPVHKALVSNGTGGVVLKNATGVFISGNIAYVLSDTAAATGANLEIIDITTPTAPVHKSATTIPGLANSAFSQCPNNAIFVSGTMVYIAAFNGNSGGYGRFIIIDASTPTAPVIKYNTDNAAFTGATSVCVSGSYAFVGSMYYGSFVGVQVVNITTPTSPVVSASIAITGGGVDSLSLNGTKLYTYSSISDGAPTQSLKSYITVIDVATPTSPTAIGNFQGNWYVAAMRHISNIVANGNFCMFTEYAPGINNVSVLNISTPSSPTLIQQITTGTLGLTVTAPMAVSSTGNYFAYNSSNTIALWSIATSNIATGPANTPTTTQNENGANIYSQMNICKGGTLAAPTSANSYLKLGSGTIVDHALTIFSGGKITLGTAGTPITSGYSCIIEFQSATTGLYGLDVKNGGTLQTYGAAKSQYQLLNANISGGATSLTLAAIPTGWLNGDTIVVPSTTTTSSQSEAVVLSANVTTTTATCGALANAHSGTAPTQAEICNLTRNVIIRGLNATTGTGYVTAEVASIISVYNTEFGFLGANVSNKNGLVHILTTTGSFTANGCTFHDSTGAVRGVYTATSTGGFTLQNCTVYNVGSFGIDVSTATTTGTNTLDNCITIKTTSGGYSIQDNSTVVTNCRAIGSSSSGFIFSQPGAITATINNCIAHSNASGGIAIDTVTSGVFGSLTAWNNTTYGLHFQPGVNGPIIFNTGTLFGNTTRGIDTYNGSVFGKYIFNNYSIHDNATAGLYFSSANMETMYFNSCTIGPNNTTADIQIGVANSTLGLYFNNCTFSSTTELAGQTNISGGDLYTGICMTGNSGNSNINKTYLKNIIISADTTYYNTASPSERITPNTSAYKSRSSSKFINLNSGDTATISVFVYKSVTSYYNGNAPRLILKQNDVLGIASDTVLATSVTSNGNWELLSATTSSVTNNGVIELCVDCDGTTGWINVDDWSVS